MIEMFDSEFYKRILDQLHSNVYITDVETDEIVYMNEFMKEAYGLAQPEGKICWRVLQTGMTKRCEFCKIHELEDMPCGNEKIWKVCSPVTGKTYMNFDILQEWNGKKYHIQNAVDITDKIQLSVDATTDELTTLLNRQAGKKRLESTLKDMKDGEQFIVALCDINGLKWVNDTFGHLEGDRLLRYAATTLKEELTDPDFIFRLSGDEFIIVFMNRELHQVNVWMKNMLTMLEKKKSASGIEYSVSFSYGLAKVRGEECLTVSDVLSVADTQMYIQKRDYHIAQGKKRFQSIAEHRNKEKKEFKYSQEYLFDAFAESVEGYAFIGNLKTGEFMYSQKMVIDFGLPKPVLSDAALFWEERIHPEDKELFLKSNQEVADGKADRHTITYRAKNADGKWVHLLCKGRMIRDSEGIPDLFAGVIRNLDKQEMRKELVSVDKKSFYFVDEREETETAEIEGKLLNFVNRNIPGGIMAAYDEPDYPLVCFNQKLLEYTNCTYEELMHTTGGRYGRLIHEEDRAMVSKSIKEQLEEKDTYEIYYRIVRNDGQFLWVYEIGRYAVNENGKTYILSFFVDATDEMEQETELRYINENSTTGVFKAFMTEGFPVFYANDGYYKIHGYTKKQMEAELENEAEKLLYPLDEERISQEILSAMERKQQDVILEYRIIKRDGSIAWLHADAGLRKMADGRIVMVGTVMDITERHLLEERLLYTEQLYHLIRNHTKLNVWEFDVKAGKIIMTDGSEQAYGEEKIIEDIPESIIRKGVIHPDSINTFREGHLKVIHGEDKVVMTVQIMKDDGTTRWEKITYISFHDEDGITSRAVGFSEDATAQKETEIRVFNEEKMHEVMAKDMIYGFRLNLTKDSLEEARDTDGRKVERDLSFVRYEDVYQKILDSIENENDQKNFKKYYSPENVKTYADNDSFVREFDLRQKDSDGNILWVNLNFKIISSPNSGDKILFVYARNIDLMKRRELSLQKKAEIDGISGLYNQATTKLLVDNIVKDKNRKEKDSVFILVNVDHFKEINRTGGFMTGDRILRQMSAIIRRNAPSSCVTGRLCSDMFALCYYDIRSKKEAHNEIEKLKNALTERYTYDNQNIDLTVSVGAAYVFGQESSYEELFQNAQYALDVAKRNGGNCIFFYDEIKRGILEKDIYIRGFENIYNKELTAIFRQGWVQARNGESAKNIYRTFLSYLAKYYKAEEATLCKRNKEEGVLQREVAWNAYEKGETYPITNKNIAQIESVLKKSSSSGSILINGKNSAGYEEMCRIYEVDEIEYPVLVAALYEKEQLVYCIVIEKGDPDITNVKPVELVLEMIQRIDTLYSVRKDYEHAIHHDRNTGVKNYESYRKKLERINEDTLTTLGMVGVQMVDLKKYNQRYGNAKGDESILFVSELLSELFGKENCYRMNRTSFFALCENMSYESFREKCQRLEEEAEKFYSTWIVTANAWEQYSISVKKMQEQIEEKLVVAQNKKRNFKGAANDKTTSEILQGIQKCIRQGNFCTFLQPKADVSTRKVCGAEALLRYKDEKNGIVSPGRFLPVIEKAGLIRHIDLFILKDVCRILQKWISEGFTPFPISLNYSRATILEPEILEETNRIVESFGIPKELIEIEITESIGSIDGASLKNIVERFSDAGYKIALDDYGAEYSNVYILYSLKLNTLKLDRRIINDIYHDKKARIVVENVIDICKKFHITSVAEGVEAKEHLEVLKEVCCDMVQGYYINKPLDENEFHNQYIQERR